MLALNRGPWLVFCSGGALAALVVCGLFLVFAPGTLLRSLAGSDDEAVREEERSRDLEEQSVAILNRVNTKCSLGAEVVEGRLGLLEAAARFRDLDRQWPALERDPRQAHASDTDEQYYCRAVIAVVGMILHDRPETRAVVLGCLEAELRGHLARGNLRLPEGLLPGCDAATSKTKNGQR
jgi:hypothetical protein